MQYSGGVLCGDDNRKHKTTGMFKRTLTGTCAICSALSLLVGTQLDEGSSGHRNRQWIRLNRGIYRGAACMPQEVAGF